MVAQWLLFLHIAAAAFWVGGGVLLAVVAFRARSSTDAAYVLAFGRILQYAGPRVLGPSMVVLLLAGIGLVIVQSHSFTELWILIALAGFAVAFVIGTIFLSRIGIELNRVVDSSNPDDAGARADRPWFTSYGMLLVILVVVLWDMVFKPGGL